MKMPAKDYFLNYHSIIQYGDRESSLKQRPVLKLGQQAGRDETSYMKDILMTIRKQEEDKAERMEQQAMRFVKKQLRDEQLIKEANGLVFLLPSDLQWQVSLADGKLDHKLDVSVGKLNENSIKEGYELRKRVEEVIY